MLWPWNVLLHYIVVTQAKHCRSNGQNTKNGVKPSLSKGQLISKCLFDVIVWTKNQRKNFQNFCPIEAKTEILEIFSLVFCPNDDTKKTF